PVLALPLDSRLCSEDLRERPGHTHPVVQLGLETLVVLFSTTSRGTRSGLDLEHHLDFDRGVRRLGDDVPVLVRGLDLRINPDKLVTVVEDAHPHTASCGSSCPQPG